MKNILILIAVLVIAFIGFSFFMGASTPNEEMEEEEEAMTSDEISITPISHATMVLTWDDQIIYTDPVGGAEVFAGQPEPTLVLVTDIHGDHLDADTLSAVATGSVTIIAPQAVVDALPEEFADRVTVLANDQSTQKAGLSITAIPMYNLPESEDSRHVKGRGNGYVLEKGGQRVYIAGDTQGIPEMRALTGIDIAFVPMNLPYTMDVEEAADAVLEFKPAKVYPYHYRTPEGLSDVAKFKELVNAGDLEIEVVQLEWYPQE